MKKDDPEYKTKLWEFFAEQGGVKGLSQFAAQGWYIRKEREFQRLLEANEFADRIIALGICTCNNPDKHTAVTQLANEVKTALLAKPRSD